MTFRQKIILTYIGVFLLFLALMIPFATRSATAIMYGVMEERANELIAALKDAPNEVALITTLKDQKPTLFYRVTLINSKRQVLYDTHTKRLLGGSLTRDFPVQHKEVLEAFEKGAGYNEEYSVILKQDFAYFAKRFEFHGEPYVVRISFPLRYVMQITQDFKIGFVFLSTLILLLFSVMTWIILNYLTRPIQEIISAITPFQKGTSQIVPEIKLKGGSSEDEFGRLAETLNALSRKIQQQISHLIEERKEKELVLDSLVEGVVAVDRSLEVIYANSSALNIFGVESPKDIFQGEPNKLKKSSLERLKSCQTEGAPLIDLIELEGEGSKRYYQRISVPIKGSFGAILILQDQTSQHRIVEMKREFVANASHELRTPITIIRGFAETLEEPQLLTEEQVKGVVDRIVRNCERMTTLIEELLLLSDIEHLPEGRIEECDLLELLPKCRELVLEAWPEAEITMDAGDLKEALVFGIPNLLERALFNLIENGVKYSKDKEIVRMTVKDRKTAFEVNFTDFGIGIPPEDLDLIFTRFYRSAIARSSKKTGSGLGLAIVEAIVQKHGGRLKVVSALGKGTTFTLTLPKLFKKRIS
jgi:signal transduction histidine kinase